VISILMPSRRPERFKACYESILETTEGEFEVLVNQNPDMVFDVPEGVQRVIQWGYSAPRLRALEPLAKGDLLVAGADDFLWKTPGWDQRLKERAAKDPIACFYFDDGHRPMTSRIPIITRGFYEVAGFFPEGFHHAYGDTWVVEVAKMAGCLFEAFDVVIEHLHPKFGIVPRDDVHNMRPKPQNKLWDETKKQREDLADKLKEAILKAKIERSSEGPGAT
jgi:hypothetical protein